MAVKLFQPYISEESRSLVQEVLSGTTISSGPMVKQFEKELEETLNLKNVTTVNSGTSALELAYEIAGLVKRDEVIVPVLTCTATNIPLARRGVKVVFADIETDLNVSVLDVAKKITHKTRAIVFVHFGGNNRGLKEILALAKKRNILVIEDAAQALGSTYWGKADMTCVSFGAIKTITTGDGGMIVCKRKKDADKARRLRWYGYDREKKLRKGDCDLTEAGFKMNMNEIAAAIGIGNLHDLPGLLDHRRMIGEIYKSYGMFAHVWLAGGFTKHYTALKSALGMIGYEIGQHHYRNDQYTIFGGRKLFPNMGHLEKKYFFAPLHHGVTEEDAHTIGTIYERFQKA